jgi:hypothetical protein
VDHGCLHEVECYTRDGVLRVLDRQSRCVAGATGARSPERLAAWAVFVGLKRSEKRPRNSRRSDWRRRWRLPAQRRLRREVVVLAPAAVSDRPTPIVRQSAGASFVLRSRVRYRCGCGLTVGVRSQSAPAEPRTCRCRWCDRGRRPDGCYGPA